MTQVPVVTEPEKPEYHPDTNIYTFDGQIRLADIIDYQDIDNKKLEQEYLEEEEHFRKLREQAPPVQQQAKTHVGRKRHHHPAQRPRGHFLYLFFAGFIFMLTFLFFFVPESLSILEDIIH